MVLTPLEEKFFISLLSRMPVPGTTTLAPKWSEMVWVSTAMLPF